MPQNKKIIQLGISLLMALVFVNFYLKGKEQNIENSYGMVEVVAASRDIPRRIPCWNPGRSAPSKATSWPPPG